MRACSWISAVAFAVAAAVACGSDDEDEGKPNEGEPTPAPGVCRALCCADTDCASGETCIAFVLGSGTLGACSGTGSGTWGGGSTMPAGCWTLNTPDCDPLSNDKCTDGDICDYRKSSDPEFADSISCTGGDHTKKLGETCDDNRGPWCELGSHCVPN